RLSLAVCLGKPSLCLDFKERFSDK
ncbi:hypothetical protein RRG08_062429, partial [Elysia crispata]